MKTGIQAYLKERKCNYTPTIALTLTNHLYLMRIKIDKAGGFSAIFVILCITLTKTSLFKYTEYFTKKKKRNCLDTNSEAVLTSTHNLCF